MIIIKNRIVVRFQEMKRKLQVMIDEAKEVPSDYDEHNTKWGL